MKKHSKQENESDKKIAKGKKESALKSKRPLIGKHKSKNGENEANEDGYMLDVGMNWKLMSTTSTTVSFDLLILVKQYCVLDIIT